MVHVLVSVKSAESRKNCTVGSLEAAYICEMVIPPLGEMTPYKTKLERPTKTVGKIETFVMGIVQRSTGSRRRRGGGHILIKVY